jgi:SAM-dependent methyltransferase
MFSHTVPYYDAIYLAMKDYGAEAERLTAFMHQYRRSTGNRLLDVACGTGLHLSYLKQYLAVEGLDIDEGLLAIARQRNPEVPLHHADMTDFDLGGTFDVVTCLFSAIGYVKTLDNLSRAVQCMAQHLSAGGVLLIEPWFTPETWRPGTVHARFIDDPDLKIARINTSFVDGRLSYMDMHYLIGTSEGTGYYVERHELGLFTSDEMTHVLTDCGLEVTYDAEGLTGRGLYIGQRECS